MWRCSHMGRDPKLSWNARIRLANWQQFAGERKNLSPSIGCVNQVHRRRLSAASNISMAGFQLIFWPLLGVVVAQSRVSLRQFRVSRQPVSSPGASSWAKKALRLAVVLAGGLSVCRGYGQMLLPEWRSGGIMRLRQADFAVLERQQPRNDLPCTVSRIKPELDWDFTFHTGYRVEVPLTNLVGNGTELTILFRVVPQDRRDDPVYMVQRTRVPAVEEGSKGEGTFYGIFTVGEGKYHVDWLMRNRKEHVCAVSWDLETKLNSKDSHLRQWIPQTGVQPLGRLFAEEPPVIHAPKIDLPRVSIIVTFDPPTPAGARLNDRDLESLMAILRRIARDPRIELHSIIVCSLDVQQVVYQQENTSGIPLPALGEALKSLKLGIVNAKQLAFSHGPAQFASDLIREQLKKENADALVVLGRKTGWDDRVSRGALASFDKPAKPVYYLSYNPAQPPGLWRDPISSIIKRLHGFEYGISRPRDFFNAWSDVVLRIVRTKQAAQASAAANAGIR